MERPATKTISAAMTARMTRARLRSLALASALLAFGGLLARPVCAQQGNASDPGSGQSSSSTTQNKPQGQQTPPAHKNAAQENPFPSDVSKQAAQQQSQPADAPAAPDADQQSPQPSHKSAAAQENPFPEDVSKGAAA